MTGRETDTRGQAEAWAERLDCEFEHWERLRRQLVEREAHWAVTVMATADGGRLAAIRRELADLKQALDEAFLRAMGMLEQGAVTGWDLPAARP